MILQISFLLFLLIVTYGYYSLYLRPKRLMKWYQQILEGLGYKVRIMPFKFFGSSTIQKFKQDQKKHGDRLYSIKHQKQHYDLGIGNALNKVVLEIYNPDLLQQFLGPKNPQMYYKLNLLTANIKRVFGQGIPFSQGLVWKHKRKIMNSVFNYEFIKANIPKIIRICNDNFDRNQQQYFQRNPSSPRNQIKVDILEAFSGLFSNVILECFFGLPSTYQNVQGMPITSFLNQLNTDVTVQSYKPLSLLLGTKFLDLGISKTDQDINRRIRILRALASEKLQKRLQQINEKGAQENYTDIIQALAFTGQLQIDNSKKEKGKYTYEQLIDEFCTFYTAGTDTTSHFLQMVTYYLFQNPQYIQKLRQQISKVIKTDQDITMQNLKKLTFIDWIQNQTTRLYGPGGGIFIRYAVKDHYLRNIPIKQGLGLSILTFMNHYSPKYYKNPLQFRPERWQKQTCQNHPYAFCGFSGGPRNCIGKHLALLQSKIVLVKFVLRYKEYSLPKKDFKMVKKFITQPQKMDMTLILDQ